MLVALCVDVCVPDKVEELVGEGVLVVAGVVLCDAVHDPVVVRVALGVCVFVAVNVVLSVEALVVEVVPVVLAVPVAVKVPVPL